MSRRRSGATSAKPQRDRHALHRCRGALHNGCVADADPFARLRLTGSRFAGEGMPVETLVELSAYRELVLGPMALIERVLPGMRKRGFGRVVSVAAATVREPSPVLMLSNSHRSALLSALKTIARQAASDGVTINSVLPGRIATDRTIATAGSVEAAEAAAREQVAAGRLGTVEELAAVGAFLCSSAASYVTGTTVLVDGGLTLSV